MAKSPFIQMISFVVLLLSEVPLLAIAEDSSVPTDFTTIQAAIDDAGTVAGDTITLEAGTHNRYSRDQERHHCGDGHRLEHPPGDRVRQWHRPL